MFGGRRQVQLVQSGAIQRSGDLELSDSDSTTIAPNLIDGLEGLWSVLHTRSRHEKKVSDALHARGVKHYLPLTVSRRTYGNRVREFLVPLFDGYVFLCGDDDAVQVAWETNFVANIIKVEDQATMRADLHSIYQVVNSKQPVDLFPALRRGRRCRVARGPLRGVEGVVMRRQGVSRIFVAVTFLSKSAVVEIDAAIVEPLD